MEIKDVITKLAEMRDKNYNFPERDALTVAIIYLDEFNQRFPPELPVELSHCKLGVQDEQ